MYGTQLKEKLSWLKVNLNKPPDNPNQKESLHLSPTTIDMAGYKLVIITSRDSDGKDNAKGKSTYQCNCLL